MYSQEIIDGIVEKAIRSQSFDREPQKLYRPIGYMLGLGGKHLRPRLCLTTYNLFSDRIDDHIIYPALALETFHQFTLIHDDIMDNSPTRRGQPTVYALHGTSNAILSGDAMNILAYQYLACAPSHLIGDALKLFNDISLKVCEGQQLDMDFEDQALISMDEYMGMIALKTGVLISGAIKMGALLAEIPEATTDSLARYGMQSGLGFQIADDYLDTFGDEKVFGKPIGGDIVNNKKTWLLVECMHRAASSASDKKKLADLLKLDESHREEKIKGVRELYVNLGVKEDAGKAIMECYDKALEALDEAKLSPEGRERMVILADQMIHREK